MKLYYSPGACSLSPHIVANEAGMPLELVKVDMKTKTIARDGDFWDVNPKGYVPALELDDGEVLTEGPGHRPVPRGSRAGRGARAGERLASSACACRRRSTT